MLLNINESERALLQTALEFWKFRLGEKGGEQAGNGYWYAGRYVTSQIDHLKAKLEKLNGASA